MKTFIVFLSNLYDYFNLNLFPENQSPTRHGDVPRIGCPTGATGYFLLPQDAGSKKSSIVVFPFEPVLHLKLLRLNLLLPQRIMVAGAIKIDDFIGVLKDRLRRSQSVFTNALELRVASPPFRPTRGLRYMRLKSSEKI